jgi:hypothetical protein
MKKRVELWDLACEESFGFLGSIFAMSSVEGRCGGRIMRQAKEANGAQAQGHLSMVSATTDKSGDRAD